MAVEHPNRVWTLGHQVQIREISEWWKLLKVVDEYTREAQKPIIIVNWRIGADATAVPDRLVPKRGRPPRFIRYDNGLS